MHWEIINKYTDYNQVKDIYLKLYISDDNMYLLDFDGKNFICYNRYTYIHTEHVEYGKPRRFVSENVITVEVFQKKTIDEFLKELNKYVGCGEDLTLNFYPLWETFKQRLGI